MTQEQYQVIVDYLEWQAAKEQGGPRHVPEELSKRATIHFPNKAVDDTGFKSAGHLLLLSVANPEVFHVVQATTRGITRLITAWSSALTRSFKVPTKSRLG